MALEDLVRYFARRRAQLPNCASLSQMAGAERLEAGRGAGIRLLRKAAVREDAPGLGL